MSARPYRVDLGVAEAAVKRFLLLGGVPTQVHSDSRVSCLRPNCRRHADDAQLNDRVHLRLIAIEKVVEPFDMVVKEKRVEVGTDFALHGLA